MEFVDIETEGGRGKGVKKYPKFTDKKDRFCGHIDLKYCGHHMWKPSKGKDIVAEVATYRWVARSFYNDATKRRRRRRSVDEESNEVAAVIPSASANVTLDAHDDAVEVNLIPGVEVESQTSSDGLEEEELAPTEPIEVKLMVTGDDSNRLIKPKFNLS